MALPGNVAFTSSNVVEVTAERRALTSGCAGFGRGAKPVSRGLRPRDAALRVSTVSNADYLELAKTTSTIGSGTPRPAGRRNESKQCSEGQPGFSIRLMSFSTLARTVVVFWRVLEGRDGEDEVEVGVGQFRIKTAEVVVNDAVVRRGESDRAVTESFAFVDVPALVIVGKKFEDSAVASADFKNVRARWHVAVNKGVAR